jgi:hypothetical protein
MHTSCIAAAVQCIRCAGGLVQCIMVWGRYVTDRATVRHHKTLPFENVTIVLVVDFGIRAGRLAIHLNETFKPSASIAATTTCIAMSNNNDLDEFTSLYEHIMPAVPAAMHASNGLR